MQRARTWKKRNRQGAVAVEFAFVAPVILALILGMSQVGQMFGVKDQLASAVREGARLAAMDHSEIIGEGQTTNEKITNDVKNFLDAAGLPGDEVVVSITEVNDPDATFDLDDPANDLELFELRIEIPLEAVSSIPVPFLDDYPLAAKIVFRNARASLVQ